MSTSTDTDGVGTHAILEHVLSQQPQHTPRLPLGITATDGQLVWWEPTRAPHLLIAGYPEERHGGLLRTILASCLALDWQVHWCDTRRFGTRIGYAGDWGLSRERFATTGEAMETTIHEVHQELNRRYTVLDADPRNDQFTPLLLVCDQLDQVIHALKQAAREHWAETNPGRPVPKHITAPTVDALYATLAIGPTVGVYIVATEQCPDVLHLPSEARANFRTRWACSFLPPESLHLLFGAPSDRRAALRLLRHTNQHVVDRGHGIEEVAPLWTPNPANPATGADQRAAKRLRTLLNQHSRQTLQHQ